MAIVNYTGSFEKEINMFEEHDEFVVGKLRTIASKIGELNSSWNDDNSHKYLSTFNDALVELKNDLDKSHIDVARYFSQIQDVLDKFGTHSHVELSQLPSIDISAINASNGDGSISINEEKVSAILSEMQDNTNAAINKCNDFHPTAVSMQGSSDDVYGAVQSNLDAAASCYLVIVEPLKKINGIVSNVLADYAKRSSAIIDATAR